MQAIKRHQEIHEFYTTVPHRILKLDVILLFQYVYHIHSQINGRINLEIIISEEYK